MVLSLRRLACHLVRALPLSLLAAVAQAQPLVFLGDADLGPYEFMHAGQPRGISVDLAIAIGRELGRPVQVRLMDWGEAQERVRSGDAEVLTMLAATPEREPLYDFSAPTVPIRFSLFARADGAGRLRTRLEAATAAPLEQLRVGVTAAGLARSTLERQHPEARLVVVPHLSEGVRRLVRGEIDLLAAQEWSLLHQLDELGITGVVPVLTLLETHTNMAVRDGNTALRADLDRALAAIKASGEFDRILDRWSLERVHVVSQRLVLTYGAVGGLALLLLLGLATAVWWLRRQQQALSAEIVQRQTLQVGLQQAQERLEAEAQLKDRFLATLAHELRNPVAAIVTASQLIARLGDQADARQRSQGVIARQSAHLARLIDDLLDVGRINAGKLELRPEKVELTEILRDAVDAVRPLIDARGHRLELVEAGPAGWIHADRVRLCQVLMNLIGNAAKFTPPGGRIEIETRIDGGQAVVSVRDNGEGMEPAELQTLFEMFQQVRRDGRQGEGLGIGLWLARRLVERHGGTLEARSRGRDRGSEFILRLPTVTGAQARDDGDAATPARPPPSARRVLVVDDNRDAAESLAALLVLEGHDARTAFDGRSAIDVAAAWTPDIVLLDIGLPDIGGHEVCRQLRAGPRGASLCIVAVTGWGSDADRQASRAAGFDAHLTKPVDLQVLQPLLDAAPLATAG